MSRQPAPLDDLAPEAPDPDRPDPSAWAGVPPGTQSGFGSLDSAESKSHPPPGPVHDKIRLHGWRGERVNAKLLVWSAGETGTVRVVVGPLRNGRHEIAAKQFRVSIVRYVVVDEFGGGCGRRKPGQVPAHLKPDLLRQGNRFRLGARETRPVWISIDIPRGAVPGTYVGTVAVETPSGTARHTLALDISHRVLPPPAQWSFHLDLWQHPDAVARVAGVTPWSREHLAQLRPLLTLLADAGQKCVTTTLVDEPWNHQTYDDFRGMVRWTRRADGSWSHDFSRFDTYVRLAMSCGIDRQINCFSMVPVENRVSWFDEASGRTMSATLVPGTEPYESVWRSFLAAFTAHLRRRGWLGKTAIALDEREEDEMRKLVEFVKREAPELKIAMAGFHHPSVDGAIDDYSANWREVGRMSAGIHASRRKAGQKTTFYVACGIPKPNTFTFSPPAEACYLGWVSAALGFDGFLRWAANSWVADPEIDSRFVSWPSGDTALVYPGAASSVRFERLREGIQAFEKIRILRRDLSRESSPRAVDGLATLDRFLAGIDMASLEKRSAADWVNAGKAILFEVGQ